MNTTTSRLFFCLVLIGLSQLSWSWSAQVHTAIGDAVYRHLSTEQRAYYDAMLGEFPGESIAFRHLSAWVDSVRDEPLALVFNRALPPNLSAHAQSSSTRWHYTNEYFLKKDGKKASACSPKNVGELEHAVRLVDNALKQKALTPAQEIRLIAFIMHFLEDVHQPLHTIALVRPNCRHDRGGNFYCLRKEKGHCVLNLHQLWDGGFSAAQRSTFLRSASEEKISSLPLSMRLGLIFSESQQLAAQIYSTEENRTPHADYIRWAGNIAEQRMVKAVQHVTQYLKEHYARKH